MVRHVKLAKLRWRDREALFTVEGHVLDGEQGAVVDQNHVHDSVTDDHTVSSLNHPGKDAQSRGHRVVRAVDEDINAAAFIPLLDRGMDGLLYVGTVEVDLGAQRFVVE